jgi:hypothetical protein
MSVQILLNYDKGIVRQPATACERTHARFGQGDTPLADVRPLSLAFDVDPLIRRTSLDAVRARCRLSRQLAHGASTVRVSQRKPAGDVVWTVDGRARRQPCRATTSGSGGNAVA